MWLTAMSMEIYAYVFGNPRHADRPIEKGQGVGWGAGGILEPQRGYNASSVGDADAAITAAER